MSSLAATHLRDAFPTSSPIRLVPIHPPDQHQRGNTFDEPLSRLRLPRSRDATRHDATRRHAARHDATPRGTTRRDATRHDTTRRHVSNAAEPTPITPIENMSLRWYASLAPAPTICRKPALIADSNSGASSKRF
jgi:hypothetical protein